jgi:hypothetical protein
LAGWKEKKAIYGTIIPFIRGLVWKGVRSMVVGKIILSFPFVLLNLKLIIIN